MSEKSSKKEKSCKDDGLRTEDSCEIDSDPEEVPVMILDEVVSDTEMSGKSKNTRLKSSIKSSSMNSGLQLPPPVSPLSKAAIEPSTALNRGQQPSRIMDRHTGSRVYSSGRMRTNPLKQKSKQPNVNVPIEATAFNAFTEQASNSVRSGAIQDNKELHDQIKAELEPDNIAQLTQVESFLKPLRPDQVVRSFIDRDVDPVKLIQYMEGHMDAYYDLSTDADAFSQKRQEMDDQLWDNLVYLIPSLCRQVIQVLQREPLVVTVEPEVLVFGDVHGNFNDLHHIYRHLITAPKFIDHRVLFMGDYVDRGPKPIEIVCLLFALKLTDPQRFVLLRGNHEVLKVNRKYGFEALCTHIFEDSYLRYPVMAQLVYQAFNKAFEHLPVAALIKVTEPRCSVFCCHGGIPSQHLKTKDRDSPWTVEEINALTVSMKPSVMAPSRRAPPNHLAINELLWNDPLPERMQRDPRYQTRQFHVNKKRGGHCSYFSEKALKDFVEANDLSVVIRGHQYRPCKRTGFALSFDKHLLTLFSSSNYCGTEHNTTGFAIVTKAGRVTAKVLRPLEDSILYKDFNIFRMAVDERTKKVTKVVF